MSYLSANGWKDPVFKLPHHPFHRSKCFLDGQHYSFTLVLELSPGLKDSSSNPNWS